jgi:hypothetical protein
VGELGDAGHLHDRVVAAGHQRGQQGALADALADDQARAASPQLVGAQRALDERQQRGDQDELPHRAQVGEDAEALRRLVVLRQGALQRQGGALRQDAQVCTADPGRQVVGQSMRLLVGACHHHHGVRWREAGTPRGEMAGPRGGGHTKDARFRQVGPKGVDERCDAAITAA